MANENLKNSEKKKVISAAMPSYDDSSDLAKLVPKKNNRLVLDEKNYKPAKTRSELYQELEKREKKIEEDIYYFPNPIFRGMALVIDAAFIYGMYLLSGPLNLIEQKFVTFFLAKYNLVLSLPQNILNYLFQYGSLFLMLLFFVIIPLAFFNTSLGKRIFGIRVRGVDSYTLTLSLALKREFIYKPLSIAVVLGFILPFTNKEKQSIHDKLSRTLVVKD